MKFLVKSVKYEELKGIVRRFGYAAIFDKRSGQESFVRRLGEGYYPRFHLYLEERNEDLIVNLHLDQKQASYAGQHMHNAEYDGDLVTGEISYLLDFVKSNNLNIVLDKNNMKNENNINKDIKINPDLDIKDVLNEIDPGDLNRDLDNWKKNNNKKSIFTLF